MKSRTNRIKEVLIEKGIEQIWLAGKLGKSFTIVNVYVCNRRQPNVALLLRIADFTGQSKDFINTKDDKFSINS